MQLPNTTSSDLPSCFSLALLAVSLLLVGPCHQSPLRKQMSQSSARTVVMAPLLQVSWVGSGSVLRKRLQNRRLISSLFVYGWFWETQKQPYSLYLSVEACRHAVENLSPPRCSSTDLSPETICFFGCTLEKFIQSNGILQRKNKRV